MSGHTPGPWKVGFADGSGKTYITHGDGIAIVSGCADDYGIPQGVLKQKDASLIAAAPDLLEALRDAECELACSDRQNSYVIDKVRAAIAKATGEKV